eukprot:TRINITY_DN4896_c0_g1_i1.p1 TRINITY_DN4896_c0_g1~~TRINITY_DN4896_c0_g1_i1.p1  ORF type:complete len:325 (+),score=34.06 TRINITY_DN4896_c0_g1_i1:87-1061(+)
MLMELQLDRSVYAVPDNLKAHAKVPSFEAESEVKRKRASTKVKACVYCQKSHASCDSTRPCKRCVERGITDLCIDATPKKRGRKCTAIEKTKEEILKMKSPETFITPSFFMTPSLHSAASSTDTATLVDWPTRELEDMLMFAPMESFPGAFESYSLHSVPSKQPPPAQTQNAPPPRPEVVLSSAPSLPLTPSPASQIEEKCGSFEPNDWLPSVIEFLKSRIPEGQLNWFLKNLREHIRPRLQKVREMITKEIALEMLAEFDENLKLYSTAFEKTCTPTIIWEKGGIIQYCNKAYRDLTGFSRTLPTPKGEFAMFSVRFLQTPQF